MSLKKRSHDKSASPAPLTKKPRIDKEKNSKNSATTVNSLVNARAEEIDFPRGGGTNLNPLEYRELRDEARREVDEELFNDPSSSRRAAAVQSLTNGSGKIKRKRKRDAAAMEVDLPAMAPHKLSYHNITLGTRVLCQIISVKPLALVVSLPGQMTGHIPITRISNTYSDILDKAALASETGSPIEDVEAELPPELEEIYHAGEYLRAVVVQVNPKGTKADLGAKSGGDELQCGRLELSISPDQLNDGIGKRDLVPGLVVSAAIKSAEDHGYTLEMGVPKIKGFVSFGDAKGLPGIKDGVPPLGKTINCAVKSMASNGRTCTVTCDPEILWKSPMSNAATAASIGPGSLVSGLITELVEGGLQLQVLGLFEGSVHSWHVPLDEQVQYRMGQRVQARVIYDVRDETPPKLALSLMPHLITMQSPMFGSDTSRQLISEAFPRGTVVTGVKILSVHKGWGVTCQVFEGVRGAASISHLGIEKADLSEVRGPRKVGSVHSARILGFSPMDALLNLTMDPEVVEQKYMTANDVNVGDVVKVTVRKIAPNHMVVNLSPQLTGLVLPTQLSETLLKHPERKYPEGKLVKARVIYVDATKNLVRLSLKKSIVNSELPTYTSFSDAKLGDVVHATLYAILEHGVLLEFFGNCKGFVSQQELSDEPVISISQSFAIGQVVKVRINRIDTKDQKLICSIRQALPSYVPPATIDVVSVGDIVEGEVTGIVQSKIFMTIKPSGVKGFVFLSALAKKRKIDADTLQTQLKVGESLESMFVTAKDPHHQVVTCSFKQPRAKKIKVEEDEEETVVVMDSIDEQDRRPKKPLAVGDVVEAKVTSRYGVRTVLTARGWRGHLLPTDACDDYSAPNATPFPAKGSLVQAIVIAMTATGPNFSTRLSRLSSTDATSVTDPEITSVADISVGQRLRGFVAMNDEDRCRVVVGPNLYLIVSQKESPTTGLEVGQVVSGSILKIDGPKILMSLRSPEELAKSNASMLTIKDLSVGQEVKAVVTRLEEYGILLRIEESKVVGLCHRTELTPGRTVEIDDMKNRYKPGDPLRVFVLKIDRSRKRVQFTLLRSRFAEVVNLDELEMGATGTSKELYPNRLQETLAQEGPHDSDDAVSSEEDEVLIGASPTRPLVQSGLSTRIAVADIPSLKLDGGFKWNGHEEQAGDSDSSEEVEESTLAKDLTTPKVQIQHDLTANMHKKAPETSAEFERMLKVTPDSSFLWLQFMAFQLQISEVEKARQVGRRALEIINFREEQEKLNVWMALLNIEITYGTDDSCNTIFDEASRANDALTAHLSFASLLQEAGKHELANEIHQRTTKKFATSQKVWTSFGEFLLRTGQVNEARELLPRSLKSLEKRNHLETISKFALLEYKYGEPERGKTIFEGIVGTHPKRLDQWSIYIDQEAKLGDIDPVRIIFGRLLSLKLSSKKAKFVFKKWLEIEKTIGSEEGADAVKGKAIEWTQRQGTRMDEDSS